MFKTHHAEVHVPDGKTGRRVVYSTFSLGYLVKWMNVHPNRKDKTDFLWVSEANYNRGQPMLHGGAQKLINRCFEKAEVSKKHNFHWFRHSRATLLAPKLTVVLLCKYMGWSIGTRQIKTYVHLCSD